MPQARREAACIRLCGGPPLVGDQFATFDREHPSRSDELANDQAIQWPTGWADNWRTSVHQFLLATDDGVNPSIIADAAPCCDGYRAELARCLVPAFIGR